MQHSSGQWVIKVESDQVKGPYSTDAVKKMIINGAFSGNEEISAYPEGEWMSLTRQPEFYDALLESLENPVEVDIKKAQKMEAETVVTAEPAPKEKPAAEDIPLPQIQNADDIKAFVDGEMQQAEENKKNKERDRELARAQQQPAPLYIANAAPGGVAEPIQDNFFESRDKNLEIQMTDIQKLKRNELKKLVPFLLLVLLIAGGLGYLFYPSSQDLRAGWALMTPKKNFEPVPAEDIKKFKKNAVRAFQTGLMEQLLQAQPGLVQVVENSPKDLESMGLLCMLYEQVWPFSKQTQDDQKAITTVTQMARNLNPISNYSDTCQAVSLLLGGHAKEARSLIEKTLDSQSEEKFSLGAFLYLLKGEILENESNFINAAAYYEQAAKLWPQWITAKFGLARMYYKQNKFAESAEEYRQIYDANKESKAALFGLGLIELKGNRNPDKAVAHFANGFPLKQQLPKDFQVEALLNYAQTLMEKNDSKNALIVAQQGFRMSPGHRQLHDLVVSLGGDDKVENSQSELMMTGKQFFARGDYLVAAAQFKAAFDVDRNAMAAYLAAKSLWKLNQTRDAITWLDKSIAADPKLLEAYVLKADYESQKYNFMSAAKALQVASKKFPRNHEVMKAQALLEFRKNNMVGAITYGENAVKIYNADVELLTLLAQAHIYYYLNAPATRKEDLQKKEDSKAAAEKYAGRALDLEPAWPEAQITQAKALAAFKGAMRGETYLKQNIKDYPYSMEYRLALAELYTSYEKYSDAAAVYEEIVNIEPKNKKANLELAETYRIMGKPDQAQKYYNATSVLDPSDVEPMFANAKLLIETASGNQVRAKIEQALAKLDLVKKINPDFPKVNYMMAKCYLELNDYQKAIDYVREEKTRNPNIADSYILAAEVFYRKRQYKDCATEYSSAIKMRPSKADLYIRASICYRQSDAIDIAQDMVDTAFERESGNAENFREQGYICKQRGEKARAVSCFEKYLDYSPNAMDKQAVQDEITQIGVGGNGICRIAKESN